MHFSTPPATSSGSTSPAHRLAASSVSASSSSRSTDRAADQVNAGECDIVMSGISVTTLRASRAALRVLARRRCRGLASEAGPLRPGTSSASGLT
jgi:hypothetical protein